MWLSLGPLPQTRGQPLPGLGLYGVLLRSRAGLRRPARAGALRDDRGGVSRDRWPASARRGCCSDRRGRVADRRSLLAIAFLVEAAFAPMPVNQTWGGRRGRAAGARRAASARAGRLSAARAMPGDAGRRRVSVRRSRLGAALRLLLHRPLEAAASTATAAASRTATSARRAAAARRRERPTRRGGRSSTPARRT